MMQMFASPLVTPFQPATDASQNLSASQLSLSSSVFEFVHEHGHRYHHKAKALLPNNEAEQDRLDLQHHIFRMLLNGGLTHTVLPDDKPLEIIDIGCGTGIWAIEMGDSFPNATIRGIEYVFPTWSLVSITRPAFTCRYSRLYNLRLSLI
jgi:hypothetical protein